MICWVPISISLLLTLSPSSSCKFSKKIMEEQPKEETEKVGGWMSVPAFGEWEQHKGGAVPDYSIDFSKIRENRRRNKSHVSIGDDDGQFFTFTTPVAAKSDPVSVVADADRVGGGAGDPVREIHRPILERPNRRRSRSPKRIKKIMNYLKCCGPLGA